jgi:hypothetical protein|nr:MAG TPA: hypothetical protein [Caudoviricetes sp.]
MLISGIKSIINIFYIKKRPPLMVAFFIDKNNINVKIIL